MAKWAHSSLQSSQILADMANRTYKIGKNYPMLGIEEDLLGTLGQTERRIWCQLTTNLPGERAAEGETVPCEGAVMG